MGLFVQREKGRARLLRRREREKKEEKLPPTFNVWTQTCISFCMLQFLNGSFFSFVPPTGLPRIAQFIGNIRDLPEGRIFRISPCLFCAFPRGKLVAGPSCWGCIRVATQGGSRRYAVELAGPKDALLHWWSDVLMYIQYMPMKSLKCISFGSNQRLVSNYNGRGIG